MRLAVESKKGTVRKERASWRVVRVDWKKGGKGGSLFDRTCLERNTAVDAEIL
jgi:hypothetical protein